MPLFRRAPRPEPDRSQRLPPGQVLTDKWPVLHYGAVPNVQLDRWSFRIFGEVEEEIRVPWEELQGLGREERVNDVHCVTRWSRYDNRWAGIPVREVLGLARPRPGAGFVMLHAVGGWTTNLPLADFVREENLLATHHDGEPLTAEHGGPLRAVVPHLYFWKSAKWLNGIELMTRDRPGFWERNGYHMRGDPWREERYGRLGF